MSVSRQERNVLWYIETTSVVVAESRRRPRAGFTIDKSQAFLVPRTLRYMSHVSASGTAPGASLAPYPTLAIFLCPTFRHIRVSSPGLMTMMIKFHDIYFKILLQSLEFF